MNTIRFKAWDKENKCMVHSSSDLMTMDGKNQFGREWTYLQFTNKEIDGKELYDSDIVEGVYGEQSNEENPIKIRGLVKFESGCFVIDFIGVKGVYLRDIQGLKNDQAYWRTTQSITNHDWFYQIKDMRIIGNYYQNPELLITSPK